jgi:hypothetical protein
MEGAGRLGVTLTLPGTDVFPAGLRQLMSAVFDVSTGAVPDSVTVLGFGDAPVTMSAMSAGGGVLPVVFDAGNLTLEAIEPTITGLPGADGFSELTVRGLRGKTYQLLRTTNLETWRVVDSAEIGPSGTVTFTVKPAGNRACYRAAPAP